MSWYLRYTRNGGHRNEAGEAKRSLESFLKESCFGRIRYHRISPCEKGSRKSGDNSDRKLGCGRSGVT
ncbi:hypothetical protein [Paenibacillus sp. FSL K6-0108]|uniref:hypothetical protein n=1 Tax=Paenibacillus sp. FSL K6-0108 TaxID=2921417 RepID=UPI003245317B